MSEKISPSLIAPRALEAARQLRDISTFLAEIDSLETRDIPNWEYMKDRFFTTERDLLIGVAEILENELAPEAEKYA